MKNRKLLVNNLLDSITFSPLEPLQQQYLVDNILAATKDVAKNKKAIVQQAPTGSGKSFTITHATIPALLKQHTNIEDVFFVSPTQECVDEPYETMKKFDNTYVKNKCVRVYSSKELRQAINGNYELEGDIKIYFMTTQFMYGLYECFDAAKSNTFELRIPGLVINDEAHRGLGVPDAETTKQDTGTNNKNWDPKWFQMQEQLMLAGSIVIHLTATPTESQKMLTGIGANKYLALPPMPKFKEANAFTFFDYHGNREDLSQTLEAAFTKFSWQVSEVKNQQKLIPENVWSSIEDKIPRMMPGLILSMGRSTAVNGLRLEEELSKIAKYVKKINGVLFVSTHDQKSFDGIRIKRMIQGIKLANSDEYKNRPLVMVVVESGKMGINIPRLLTAVVCKIPAQKKIHNNYSQFVARTCRLPFFRDHDTAIDYIKSLNVTDEVKSVICSYYSLMSTSFAILPQESELMKLVEEFYTDNTFSILEGIDYIYNGVFGKKDPLKLISGLKIAFDRGDLNKLFRKDYCEAHNNLCMEEAVKGYIKVYGDDTNTLGNFINNWKTTLQVDHKDRNRYNNHPSNHVTECPNVHMLKTQRQQDYLGSYF